MYVTRQLRYLRYQVTISETSQGLRITSDQPMSPEESYLLLKYCIDEDLLNSA